MNPIEVLETSLIALQKQLDEVIKDYEYNKHILSRIGDKQDKLESSVFALQKAIQVLKNQ